MPLAAPHASPKQPSMCLLIACQGSWPRVFVVTSSHADWPHACGLTCTSHSLVEQLCVTIAPPLCSFCEPLLLSSWLKCPVVMVNTYYCSSMCTTPNTILYTRCLKSFTKADMFQGRNESAAASRYMEACGMCSYEAAAAVTAFIQLFAQLGLYAWEVQARMGFSRSGWSMASLSCRVSRHSF